jgi:hypothetical protein
MRMYASRRDVPHLSDILRREALWVHREHSFFGKPGKQHADGGHMLFDRGRRRPVAECFDVGRDRDPIPGALGRGQELLYRPVISVLRVRVADRDRKKPGELLAR